MPCLQLTQSPFDAFLNMSIANKFHLGLFYNLKQDCDRNYEARLLVSDLIFARVFVIMVAACQVRVGSGSECSSTDMILC